MRGFNPIQIALIFIVSYFVQGAKNSTSSLPKFGVSVGLRPQVANVIKDDDVNQAFKDGTYLVGSSVQFSKFYYFTSSKKSNLWLNRPTVVSSENDCSPDIEDWDANESAMQVVDQDKEKYFIIKYDCLVGGQVTITLHLKFSLQGKEEKHKIYQLVYKYMCPAVQRDVGNVISGFNIGTQSRTADVVKDGLTHPGFALKENKNNIASLYTVDDNSDSFTFSVWSTRPLNVEHPEVDVVNSSVVQIVPLGWPLNPSSILEPGYPRQLTLLFRCIRKGKSLISVATSAGVDLNANGDSTQEVVFSFNKICSSEHDVQGAGIFGLTVSTRKGKTDVVKNGITQRLFQRAANKVDQAVHERLEVSASEKTKTFYVELDADAKQIFDQPFVIARSPTGERIARPQLSGTLMAQHLLKSKKFYTLLVTFHCFRQGASEVTVIIPVPPSGSISFTFLKKCPMSNYLDIVESAKVEEEENHVPKWLTGFNVGTKKLKEKEKDVIQSAIPLPNYHWDRDEDDLRLVKATRHYLHFFISIDTNLVTAPIGFDPPVISSSLAICRPVITNHGSLGGEFQTNGIFTRKDRLRRKRKAKSPKKVRKGKGALKRKRLKKVPLTISFNCHANGTSVFTLSIPAYLTVKNSTQHEIKITFRKECRHKESDIEPENSGGIYINGFFVGTKPGAKDVVVDGFPLTPYFGQRLGKRKTKKSQWRTVLVGTEESSTTFTLSFLPHPERMKQKTNCRRELGAYCTPKDPSGTYCCKDGLECKDGTCIKDTSTTFFSHTLEYQAPLVMTHQSIVHPTLSGPGSLGGVLIYNQTIDLTLTYNCRFKGVASIVVKIPLLPLGVLTFTVPKQCLGKTARRRIAVPGLHVGLKEGKKNVVKSGLTRTAFEMFKKGKSGAWAVWNEYETVFYVMVEKREKPIITMEPIVMSHRPICNPIIKHKFKAFLTEKDKKRDHAPRGLNKKWSLGPGTHAFTIIYNCVTEGQGPVTVMMPLLPRGQVSWTWTKQCGTDPSSSQAKGDVVGEHSGLAQGDYDDYYDYGDYYDVGYPDFADYYAYLGDEYYDYDDKYYDGEYYDDKDYEEFYDDYRQWDEVMWNPDLKQIHFGIKKQDDLFKYESLHDLYHDVDGYYDYYEDDDYEKEGEGWSWDETPTGYIDVGTGPDVSREEGHNVVFERVALKRYSLPRVEPKPGEWDDEVGFFEKSRTRDYYLSVAFNSQKFDLPTAFVKQNKNQKPVVKVRLSGPAAIGGEVYGGGRSMKLSVNYECINPGVVPVVITVPMLPHGLGAVSFRIIKICSNFKPVYHFYWTVNNILLFIGGVLVGTLLLIGVVWYACLNVQTKQIKRSEKESQFVSKEQEVQIRESAENRIY